MLLVKKLENTTGNKTTNVLLFCYVLYSYKHEKMFTESGDFKTFGLHKDETVFPYWLVTTLIGLSGYYLLVMRNNHI